MRSAQGNTSVPWRLMYRVTYSQRFLPPISNASAAVPQITPVMAVPVANPAANFLFQLPGSAGPATTTPPPTLATSGATNSSPAQAPT